jgi:hypothetical protein
MVHKSSIIPGLSKFVDTDILSQYSPTSMKRIIGAGAAALFLRNNEQKIYSMLNSLGIVRDDNMIDIESAKDILKSEIAKAGFMRISFPVIGDVEVGANPINDMDVVTKKHVDDLISNMNTSLEELRAQIQVLTNGSGT